MGGEVHKLAKANRPAVTQDFMAAA